MLLFSTNSNAESAQTNRENDNNNKNDATDEYEGVSGKKSTTLSRPASNEGRKFQSKWFYFVAIASAR